MDVNGTRLHVLLGEADWLGDGLAGSVPAPDTAWDAGLGALTLRRLPLRFTPGRGDRAPELADRRGAAADRFGTVYWIDRARTGLLAQNAGDDHVGPFWSSEMPERPPARHGSFATLPHEIEPCPLTLAGAAVTSEHYLVVGTDEPPGLLSFDLHAGGPPRRLRWPEGVPFVPWDAAALPDGGVVVLDRELRQLWQLDRHLQVVPLGPVPPAAAPSPTFGPVEPPPAPPPDRPAPRPIHRAVTPDAAVLEGDPIAVDVLPDGTLLIVDRRPAGQPSLVRRYRDGELVDGPLRLADDDLVPPLPIVAHDAALVGGQLLVADAAGDQAWAFAVGLDGDELSLELTTDYLPMRLFDGRGLIGGRGGALYDSGERWVALVEQARRSFAETAALVTRPLDGGLPECLWHRVLLDACIPPECGVAVDVRAAEERDDLELADWHEQPSPMRRPHGPELPFVAAPAGGHWATWELLVQQVRGRWGQVRLRLAGDGRSSPALRALRVHYPRFSYLERYLPAVYREDEASASFLDRFLANPEGVLTEIEGWVADAQALIEPGSAPAGALDWLASWFGMSLDPAWDETRQRLFLRHAIDFLRLRGTPLGLQLAIRLALDPCVDDALFEDPADRRTQAIRIVERFRLRRTPGPVAGDPSEIRPVATAKSWRPELGGDDLHRRWHDETGQAAFPLARPATGAEAWEAFAGATLGFVPQQAAAPDGWPEFLSRRYGTTPAYATAWRLAATPLTFSGAAYPRSVPDDGPPLRDWFAFEAVVLAMRAAAHRFTVVLPVPVAGDEPPGALEERNRAIAERVAGLLKPAHTTFDIRFYWSAFRLGEARLGNDTVIDLGSRSGRLLAGAVLGRGHVGESVLGGEAPMRAS